MYSVDLNGKIFNINVNRLKRAREELRDEIVSDHFKMIKGIVGSNDEEVSEDDIEEDESESKTELDELVLTTDT